jgi:hypothetical protein
LGLPLLVTRAASKTAVPQELAWLIFTKAISRVLSMVTIVG